MKIIIKSKGGPGSGNHNHAGIPGQVGGSAKSAISLAATAESEKDILFAARALEKEMYEEAEGLGIKDEFSIIIGYYSDELEKQAGKYWSTRQVTESEAFQYEEEGYIVESGKVYYEENPPSWMPEDMRGKRLSIDFLRSMGLKSYFEEPPNRDAKQGFVDALDGKYGEKYREAANIIKRKSVEIFRKRYGNSTSMYRAGRKKGIISVSEWEYSASHAGTIVSGEIVKADAISVNYRNVLVTHRAVVTTYPEKEWLIEI